MDSQIHMLVKEWLKEAAGRLRHSLYEDLHIEEKQNSRDLVTEMDKSIEKFFVNQINTHFPGHQILSEEGFGDDEVDTSGYLWVIDPIDGTLNFVKAKNHFGILIGIYYQGKPLAGYIYDVMRDDLYYGLVGDGVYLNDQIHHPIMIQELSDSLIVGNVESFCRNRYNMQALLNHSLGARTSGAAAMDLISVIRGEASLYFSGALRPWDFAAGYCILTAMDYKVTDAEGNPLDILQRSSVIFAHPNVHAEAISLLKTP